MSIFVKDLYTNRKGKNSDKVLKIFGKPVLDRLFKLMKMFGVVNYEFSVIDKRSLDVLSFFLNRLYYHLSDESKEEKLVNLGFEYYENFALKTVLNKFFDSLELYCYQLELSVKKAKNESYSGREKNELEDFIENVNDLFIRNGISYRLKENSKGRVLVTLVSESKFVQERIKDLIRLTSGRKFKTLENKFIEAENAFAKRDFDEVLKKCNSIIETALCITLSKGGGTINKLIPKFLDKFKVPRALNNSISKLVGTIQHTRSSYIKDIHGKNKQIDTEDVSDILEEICGFILGETAIIGIFIIRLYDKEVLNRNKK